jgi:hypothetical protein
MKAIVLAFPLDCWPFCRRLMTIKLKNGLRLYDTAGPAKAAE